LSVYLKLFVLFEPNPDLLVFEDLVVTPDDLVLFEIVKPVFFSGRTAFTLISGRMKASSLNCSMLYKTSLMRSTGTFKRLSNQC
jgi:hypothetical protein